MQVSPEEERCQSAIDTYNTLCTVIRNTMYFGEAYAKGFTMKQLEELRDEAFRKIEMNTVEHLEAFEQLRNELNLMTDYGNV